MHNGDSQPVKDFISSYRPYAGLPPLAGLGTFQDAMRPGLSVEQSVTRLRRIHYGFKQLHRILLARLTAERIYELKMAFSHHSYLCSENVALLRTRVSEMREPPLGLDKVPHLALEVLFDEIICAPTTAELLTGVYEVAFPALLEALQNLHAEAHVLAEAPTRRLCRFGIGDVQDALQYGSEAVTKLVQNTPDATRAAEFRGRLEQILAIAGGLDGQQSPAMGVAERVYSVEGFKYDRTPARDGRFPDPYNMGSNAEVLLYDAAMPSDAKVLMMFYKRLREIDVPEVMASIITETPGKPWGYYRDMTRQLWDEARHAMMGEVGFVSIGVDWPRLVMVNFTWSLFLNRQLTPIERHAVLYFIEQGLMPKTGKRHEWEVAVQAANPLAATFQDFDWADEVLHARVGKDWYVSAMPSQQEAIAYGDECWSKVLFNWEDLRNQGLTDHENWWPTLYKTYCRIHSLEPDPAALAFDTTYESTRADLKSLPAAE